MIVKIHSRGVGRGSGPVEYLLGKDGNRNGATLDRGDPEMVRELIDGSRYAQRYTSGVLSFHEPDLPRETKERLMDEFEQALLPGLDADQYAVLWVEHRDKDRLELNFVVPNVELLSGKRLQPYFHGADGHRINAWRTAINGELGLHDPDDPINRQAVTTAKDQPRNKLEAEQAITGGLLGMAAAGLVKNREDVLKTLTGAGFDVTRTTKNSISIADPEGGRNIRLKGAIYEQDFRHGKDLRADIEAASARYRADRGERIEAARKTLNRLTERKRESHEYRYPRAKLTDTPDYIKKLDDRINRHRYSDSPSMGRSDVSELQNKQEFRANYPTESSYPRTQGKRGERAVSGLYRQEEPQATMRISEQGSRNLEERQFYGSDGVLSDDRIRKAIARSTGTDAGTAAGERRSFTADVREYTARKSGYQGSLQELTGQYFRSRSETSGKLEQLNKACQRLEWTTERLRETKQAFEQSVKYNTRAVTQVEKMNEPKRSYGFRMR